MIPFTLLLATATANKASTFLVLLLAAFLWNIGAALASYGIASAASNRPAPDILIPLLIGIVLLGTIFLVLRMFWRHHRHAEQAPVAPGV